MELCRAKHPDIALMDVRMPVFDGLTAAEAILSGELAGCVALLTAFSDRDLAERASRAGVTGYLVKPIHQNSLLPALHVAMAQSRNLRESRRQAEEARQQLQEDRRIRQAQRLLAAAQGCSEEEAYQIMRKKAMDRRIRIGELAAVLLRNLERPDPVARAKKLVMQQRMCSEDRAYRLIAGYARRNTCSIEEAARRIADGQPREG